MKQSRGVTIIELLIVLTVAAIFLALGLPSFTDFVRQIRLSSTMSDLTSAIHMARSEAIKRNTRILLCARASATSNACTTSTAATAWTSGWLVCYDADADGACDTASASDPNPIRRHDALSSSLALSGPTAAVIFFPIGNANSAATFSMTVTGLAETRTATVSPSGSVTTKKS
jgi:type IV fimbrial biogenesis protein FimT